MAAPVNPVLFYHPDGYRVARQDLKGRHSAGESFLSGFIAQSPHSEIYAMCHSAEDFREFSAIVSDSGRPLAARQVLPTDIAVLRQQGLLNKADPLVAEAARTRSFLGETAYALCGITHTISSRAILNAIADMVVTPVMPWDAVILTSRAVEQAVSAVLDQAEEALRARTGAGRFTRPMLPVIPLGTHAQRFKRNEADRVLWRRQLNLEDDAIAILFFGRLSVHAKASPFQLAQAAEQAARNGRERLAIVWCGWFNDDFQRRVFMETAKKMAPSVAFHHVDGGAADVRFSIWSAADIFCSLSDNIQETFGLTVIEAMAAELPVIVSNWDGYRDTVQDGVTGVLVDSYMPGVSLADLAYRHASAVDTYDSFIGAISQYCFVDVEQTARAISRLARDQDLRRKLATAVRRRVETEFDWTAVLPRYQDLWNRQREILERARLARGPHFERWDELIQEPGIINHKISLLGQADFHAVRDLFAAQETQTLDNVLAGVAAERRAVVLRSLYSMVKIGLLRVTPEQ